MRDWRELLPFWLEIYERNGVGCCWHIVLDDGNTDASYVEFCAKYAVEQNCAGCIAATPTFLAAEPWMFDRLHSVAAENWRRRQTVPLPCNLCGRRVEPVPGAEVKTKSCMHCGRPYP